MDPDSDAEVVVRRSVVVALAPQQAFDLFTARMGEFWPSAYSIGTAPIADVIVEPREGGRWYEQGDDGSECQWGHVAVWQPPRCGTCSTPLTAGSGSWANL